MNDDGGTAFPIPAYEEGTMSSGHPPKPGMSLRDWFAGMALAEVPDPINESDAPATARLAYAIADAMLKERKRNQSK